MDPTIFYGKGKQGGMYLSPVNATASDTEKSEDSEPEILANNSDVYPDFMSETETNGLLAIPGSDSVSDSASDSEEHVDNVPLPVPSTSNNTSGQKKKPVSFDWVKSDIEATTADLSPVFDSEDRELEYFSKLFDNGILTLIMNETNMYAKQNRGSRSPSNN